ncbi:hypothetical protein EMWEY_00048170, partial [Eimeria maxima]
MLRLNPSPTGYAHGQYERQVGQESRSALRRKKRVVLPNSRLNQPTPCHCRFPEARSGELGFVHLRLR